MSKTNQDYLLLARLERGELECGDLDNPELYKMVGDYPEWVELVPEHMGGALMFTVDFTDNVTVFKECLSCGKLLRTEDYMAHKKKWIREDYNTPPLSDIEKREALADMRRFARVILGEVAG